MTLLCALYTMIRVIKAGNTCSKPLKCFSLHWNFNKASELDTKPALWYWNDRSYLFPKTTQQAQCTNYSERC